MLLLGHMECVYHYTRLDSFIGMMKGISTTSDSNEMNFWASSAYTMDDQFEMNYGYPFIKEVLEDCCNIIEMCDEERLDSIMKLIPTLIDKPNEKYFLPDNRTPFIISFTRAHDSEFMWNNYADNGNGICLYFDANKLESITDKRRTFLLDIAYLEKHNIDFEIWNSMVNLVRYHAILAKQLIPMFKNKEDIVRYKKYILDSIGPVLSALIKGEEFINEEEVRWISLDRNENAKHRNRNESNIDFIDIKIPLDCLVGIKTGPNFNRTKELFDVCNKAGLRLTEQKLIIQ